MEMIIMHFQFGRCLELSEGGGGERQSGMKEWSRAGDGSADA